MPRSSRICFYSVFLASAPIAIAQDQVPSDAELRSAYCIPVLQQQLTLAKQIDAMDTKSENDPTTPADVRAQSLATREARQREIADLDSALKRLQAYLLPRFFQRDPVAMVAAQKRGETDWQQLADGMQSQCATRCAAITMSAEAVACINSCVNPELVARLKACKNPTWLPF